MFINNNIKKFDETILGGFSYEYFRMKLDRYKHEGVLLPWLTDFIENNNYPTPTVTDPTMLGDARFIWCGRLAKCRKKTYFDTDDQMLEQNRKLNLFVSINIRIIGNKIIRAVTQASVARTATRQQWSTNGYKEIHILSVNDVYQNGDCQKNPGDRARLDAWMKSRMDPGISLLTSTDF